MSPLENLNDQIVFIKPIMGSTLFIKELEFKTINTLVGEDERNKWESKPFYPHNATK
jgi:hypothetical protein